MVLKHPLRGECGKLALQVCEQTMQVSKNILAVGTARAEIVEHFNSMRIEAALRYRFMKSNRIGNEDEEIVKLALFIDKIDELEMRVYQVFTEVNMLREEILAEQASYE